MDCHGRVRSDSVSYSASRQGGRNVLGCISAGPKDLHCSFAWAAPDASVSNLILKACVSSAWLAVHAYQKKYSVARLTYLVQSSASRAFSWLEVFHTAWSPAVQETVHLKKHEALD